MAFGLATIGLALALHPHFLLLIWSDQISSVFRWFWNQIMKFQFVLFVFEYTEGDLS